MLVKARSGSRSCDNTGWCCTSQSRVGLEVQVGPLQGGGVLVKARSGSISRVVLKNAGWCCASQG